jgi:signal peptidase I
MNLSQYNMKLKKSWLKSELPQILLIIALVLAARSSLADHYYVPSGSMEYTLMPGDRVLVSKMAYGLRVPFTTIEFGSGAAVERGDVVIFDSPKDGVRLIKRIVGIGGDTVSISDGHLNINGAALATVAGDVERFGTRLAVLNLQDGGGPDLQGAVIPPHMLLAIGDHRGSSLDGRYFGLIGENDVYGKALGVYRRRDEGFIWNPL